MRVLKALALLALLAAPAAGKPRAEFRDFSQKGADYRPLENLRLAAAEVSYAGVEQTEFFGRQRPASKYELRASVKVQTVCAVGPVSTEVYERLPALFEVFVADDGDRSIHDSFVRSMYALWSRKELFDGGRFYDFGIRKDKYVLASVSNSADEGWFLVAWVNGRALKVGFKGFADAGKGGWGVADAFALENMMIRVGEAELKAYRYPLGTRKKFRELYERGFFTSAPAPAVQGRR